MDSESRLKGLDPTSPQDPRGDAARSTMSAAIARGSEPTAKTSRFRRPRVIIAGLGTSAAATAAALVAFVGGGSTISAAAALADAASQTSHFSSGVVTTHTVNNNGGKLDALTTLRFSGTDADVVGQGTSQLDGQDPQTSSLEVIVAGGKRYTKKDGGDWTVEDVSGQQTSYGDAIAGAGLVSLVQNASDVTQNGSTFHATVKGSDLAQVQTSPLGYDNATNASEVSVTIELAADGSVSKLEVDNDGTQRVTEFSEMGQPQTISAPTS